MQVLLADYTGVRAMAARWAASVGELTAIGAPSGTGLPSQASSVAVSAAHVDVTAFTASLAARVSTHSTNVGVADARYMANEADAAQEMEALAPRVIGV